MATDPRRKPASHWARETALGRTRRARRIDRELTLLYPDAHIELDFTTALELSVATILSAQCTDVRVNQTTPALFRRYRTAADYAAADRAELEEMIRSTGFFRNKANSIIGLGQALLERYDGEVPPRLEDLITLPGFGRKTANVVLGNAFGIPGLTVDTHLGRLARRWGWTAETDPVKVESAIAELIPRKDWTMLSLRAIWHGRRICHSRKPACGVCPLALLCPAFGEGPTDPQVAAALVKSGTRGGRIVVNEIVVNAPVPHPPWLTELVESSNSVSARQISRHVPPADGSGRRSAVLILLADAGLAGVAGRPPQASEPSVVLLLRASTMRKHPGQVAFPGGGVDPEDADATSTALREANEEIGLDPHSVDIIGRLPDLFLPVTSFVVTPVLAFWRTPHPVHAVDPAEVAGVTVVKIADLVDPANRFSVQLREDLVGPGFEVDGLFVWGFTAGVLNAVLEMAGWTVPWDTTVMRAIPASVMRPSELTRGGPDRPSV